MINLDIQIMTLVVSFFYGIFFSFMVCFNEKYLYQKNLLFRILFTFLFIFVNVLIYFILIKKVNHAILHPYALGMIVIGFCLFHHFYSKVAKHFKK